MEYISIIKDDVDLSKTHRYLRLPHPRTGQPQLYLPYTNKQGDGLLEVIKINGSQRRTWFIGDDTIDAGTILIHYPIDPLFLVIPIIQSLLPISADQQVPFQPFSDLISSASTSRSFALHPPFTTPTSTSTKSTLPDANGWNDDIGKLLELKSARRVLRLCCERKVIPAAPPSPPLEDNSTSAHSSTSQSQKYYRPSISLLLTHLRRKAAHLADPEQFGKFDHLIRSLGRDGLLDNDADVELIKLARSKSACEHLAQWLPPSILTQLLETYDFSKLSTYLANRSAASLAASITPSNSSNKENKNAGKRKAPPASRGVESLKKVNTSSMNKLTSFFKPKEGVAPPAAKKKK